MEWETNKLPPIIILNCTQNKVNIFLFSFLVLHSKSKQTCYIFREGLSHVAGFTTMRYINLCPQTIQLWFGDHRKLPVLAQFVFLHYWLSECPLVVRMVFPSTCVLFIMSVKLLCKRVCESAQKINTQHTSACVFCDRVTWRVLMNEVTTQCNTTITVTTMSLSLLHKAPLSVVHH